MPSVAPVILEAVYHWWCPACKLEQAVKGPKLQPGQFSTRMHSCPKMGMLSVPMLPQGTKAKLEAKEREDYVGKDKIRKDANGRAIMSVVTTRDDGQDTTVYAPTAVARSR